MGILNKINTISDLIAPPLAQQSSSFLKIFYANMLFSLSISRTNLKIVTFPLFNHFLTLQVYLFYKSRTFFLQFVTPYSHQQQQQQIYLYLLITNDINNQQRRNKIQTKKVIVTQNTYITYIQYIVISTLNKLMFRENRS